MADVNDSKVQSILLTADKAQSMKTHNDGLVSNELPSITTDMMKYDGLLLLNGANLSITQGTGATVNVYTINFGLGVTKAVTVLPDIGVNDMYLTAGNSVKMEFIETVKDVNANILRINRRAYKSVYQLMIGLELPLLVDPTQP